MSADAKYQAWQAALVACRGPFPPGTSLADALARERAAFEEHLKSKAEMTAQAVKEMK